MAAEAVNNRSTRGIVAYLGPAFGMAWALWEVSIRLGLSPGNPLFLLAALPLRPWQPSSSAGGPMTLLLFAGVLAWLLVAMSASFAWVPLGLLCAWIVFTGRLRQGRKA